MKDGLLFGEEVWEGGEKVAKGWEFLLVLDENGETHQIQIFFEQNNQPFHIQFFTNQIIKLMQGSPEKINAARQLITEQWKSEEDYKKMIIALQLQNEKYRNELYELGQTVNKILDKTKLPQSNKNAPPNLDQQLQLVKKELHNVNQFIEIYQRELNNLQGRKKEDQIESIAASQELLKAKQSQLAQLKKEVRELSHKNKALQYKLAQFGKKNRAKSFDQQALQLKELINENKNLKVKLQDLEQMQQKRQVWLKNNLQNVKTLQQKIQVQETRLPKIESRKTERSDSSLPKLQSQKKIYTKWLESSREKGNSKLEKELTDLEKINKMVQEKLTNTQNEINEIQQQIAKVKQRVQVTEAQVTNEPVEEKVVKKKDAGCQVSKRVRRSRRDWVGKFQSLRFSDSRIVRQQSRVYKVLFNSAGYFLFSYYAVKDPKRKFTGKLPFDPASMQLNGKESSYTVEAPDFIKNIRLKINLKTQKIIQMHLVSNLGVQGEFAVDSPVEVKSNLKGKGQQNKPVSSAKQQQLEVHYEMDVKTNQAITTIFGSYGFKADDKKVITSVWLQGIGVELIEDFVEELI